MPVIDVNGTEVQITNLAEAICGNCGGPCAGGTPAIASFWPQVTQYQADVTFALNKITNAPESYGAVQRLQDIGDVIEYNNLVASRFQQMFVAGIGNPYQGPGNCIYNSGYWNSLQTVIDAVSNSAQVLYASIENYSQEEVIIAADITRANVAIADANMLAAEAQKIAEQVRLQEVTRKLLMMGAVVLAVVVIFVIFRKGKGK